jgi:isopenicillin N synthase-like dioxygenase
MTTSDASIPEIDLRGTERAPETGACALRRAFEEVGFVGVRGHDVPDATIRRALETARALFALPDEVKRRYEVAGGAGQRGYTRVGVETAKGCSRPDRKEFWHVGREVARDHPLAHALQPNLWPEEVAGFREAQLALFEALERLGVRLLAAIARSLALPETWFESRVDVGNSILRAIHYPPVDGAAAKAASKGTTGSDARAAAHEDINLITLLVGSEEPGLEILRRDGRWVPVTSLAGTIVVNVGDMLQRLTNARLVSTTHRVVDPPPPWNRRSRHSIPFFLHFNPDALIRTLPTCIDAQHPDRFPTPIMAHDFLQERLREIGLKKG